MLASESYRYCSLKCNMRCNCSFPYHRGHILSLCFPLFPTSLSTGCLPYDFHSIFPTLSHLRWRTTTCLFMMLSVPPSDSTPASTFSFKSAPRPRVISLYATAIPRRSSRQLSIHQTLPPRARYHPYAQQKRSLPPIDTSSTSSGDSPDPDSPLTPIEPTAPSGSSREALLIQIPPPSTKVTVANAGWHVELVPRYRVYHKCFIVVTEID